eukprot:jgi/Chrzof1/12580/UNPLg00533.t1
MAWQVTITDQAALPHAGNGKVLVRPSSWASPLMLDDVQLAAYRGDPVSCPDIDIIQSVQANVSMLVDDLPLTFDPVTQMSIDMLSDSNSCVQTFEWTSVSAGTTLNITLITCLAAGSDFVGLPLVEALDNQLLGLPDVSTLMASNGAAWAQLWSGDIELVPKLLGDTAVDGMAQATRYALFRLYSAMRSGDNSNVFSTTVPSQINSVAGMMWVLPLLTLLQPPLAAAVLQYRYRALSRALNQASMYGWKGAMVSSNIRTAPLEGALLAVAAWDVYRVSQDMNALKTWIYPLLKGVADFIISRITSAVPAAVEGVVEMDPLQSKQVVPAGSAGSSLVNFVSKLALKATIEASYELSFVPKADWVGAYASLGILSYPNKGWDAATVDANVEFYTTPERLLPAYSDDPFNLAVLAAMYALQSQRDGAAGTTGRSAFASAVSQLATSISGNNTLTQACMLPMVMLTCVAGVKVSGGVADGRYYYEELRVNTQTVTRMPDTWRLVRIYGLGSNRVTISTVNEIAAPPPP